jgi:hypothetical protein
LKVPAPQPEPSIVSTPEEIPPMDDDGVPPVDVNNEQPQPEGGNDDFPFDDEKFDAGVDVDEDADPKKYIEKLTGKLAQKLRDYNGTENDVDLNKFVINSLIPASIPEMGEEDAGDVIKKVKDNIGAEGENQVAVPGEEDSVLGGEKIPSEEPTMEPEEELPPAPQQESVDGEIDELVSEIFGRKKLSRNLNNKNPFKGPNFK